MNYLPYIFFLLSLSCVSLMLLLLLELLNYTKAAAKQKIGLIKMGLVWIALSPCIFCLLRSYSFPTLEITLPGQLFNALPMQTTSALVVKQTVDVPFCLLIGYGTGLIVMLSRLLFSYISASRRLKMSLPGNIQGHFVLLNEHLHSPLSFGLPKATIYFPAHAEKTWSPREIEMSLAHERLHVEHYDSLWKCVSLLVQALLFFAPWSYVLHRRLMLEMEMLCDEKTCRETGASIQEYGDLLLAVAGSQPHSAIFSNLTDSTLKRRLLAMKSITFKRPLLLSLLSAALLFAGSTAIATTSGIQEKKRVFKIASALFMDGKLVSSPIIVTYAEQKASIVITNTNHTGAQGLRLKLIAKDVEKSDAIAINYDIEFKNDKESMHSKPQMIVTPHHQGTLTIASDSGHTFEMRVIAERQ